MAQKRFSVTQKDDEEQKRLYTLCESFLVNSHQLIKIKNSFMDHLLAGPYKEAKTSVKGINYIVTFLQDLPCGCEHGMYIVVNWSLRYVQLMLVRLRGENKPIVEDSEIRLPESLVNPIEICDQIADKLLVFLKNNTLEREQLPLILITPNPLNSKSLQTGIMLSSKTGLKLKHFRRLDVNQLLNESLGRLPQKVHLDVVAAVNQVTAAFINSISLNKKCRISVLMDSMMVAFWDNIEDLKGRDININKPNILINLTIADFGEEGELQSFITPHDIELDGSLQNQPTYVFEKLASSNCIPEVIRLVILQAIDNGLLFSGNKSFALNQFGAIKMNSINEVLNEGEGPYYETILLLERLGINAPSTEDCKRLYFIMKSVVQRSVDLIATVIAAIIDKIEQPSIAISIDGSNTELNIYTKLLNDKLKELIEINCEFELMEVHDEEGHGAALIGSLALQDNFIYRVTDPM